MGVSSRLGLCSELSGNDFENFPDPVIAMYCQPQENGTYARGPSHGLFLWGQSVFIIAQLLTGGLLHINELDPIRRYLPSYNRPRKGGRYSAFQVSSGAPKFAKKCLDKAIQIFNKNSKVTNMDP
jgi:Glycosyl hydrolases family 15